MNYRFLYISTGFIPPFDLSFFVGDYEEQIQKLQVNHDINFRDYLDGKPVKFNPTEIENNAHKIIDTIKESKKFDCIIFDWGISITLDGYYYQTIKLNFPTIPVFVHIYSAEKKLHENKYIKLVLKNDVLVTSNFFKLKNVAFENIISLIRKGKIEISNTDTRQIISLKKQIISVNTSLFNYFQKDPYLVYHLDPRKFEELVADIFSKQGFEVELTSATRDGGKDIYAFKKSSYDSTLYAIECKRYNPDRKVGRPEVQKLFSVIEHERLTGGIIATTSFFSPDAIAFQVPLANRLFLNDFNNLYSWLQSE